MANTTRYPIHCGSAMNIFHWCLKATPNPETTTRHVLRGIKKVTYTLTANVSGSLNPNRPSPYSEYQRNIVHPKPPVNIKGVAMLSYKYKGKEHYFTIDKIKTENAPLSYPGLLTTNIILNRVRPLFLI